MRRLALALITCALAATACADRVEGAAVASGPDSTSNFDPCEIPREAIAAAGLEPITGAVPGEIEVFPEGTRGCSWLWQTPREWMSAAVMYVPVTRIGKDVAAANDWEFSEVEAGTRDAITVTVDPEENSCHLFLDVHPGIIHLVTYIDRATSDGAAACSAAEDLLADLDDALPR